jgi:flagellar hook-associated protein 2
MSSSAISVPGIGSGLDVNGIVSKLMAVEQVGLNKIKSDENSVKTKLSIYGILKSSFSAFQDASKTLTNPESLNPMTTTSGDATKITATANSSAPSGSYTLAVTKLAQSQRLVSSSLTSSTNYIGSGTMTISLGSYDSTNNKFTERSDKTPVTINIGSGQGTLVGIKNAINSANAGVTASIVNDGSGFRLSISSKETGANNSIKISTSDADDGTDTDLNSISQFAYDPTLAKDAGKNLASKQTAQDAELTIDGIDIKKPSNTISDAIEGVTFNLLQPTTTDVKIDVNRDTAALKKNLDTFVKAYNDVRNKLSDQQTKGATLQSDTTPGALQRQLRKLLGQTVPAYSTQLADVGISIDRTGIMSVNSTKLDTALSKDPNVIKNLFSDTAVSSDSRVSFKSATSKTVVGTYGVNITTAPSTGVSVAGSINGVNGTGSGNSLVGATGDPTDGLNINIPDGVSGDLGTVKFSRGIASTLSNWIDSLNADGGSFNSRDNALNAQLKRLTASEDRYNTRLTDLEKRYRAQYAKLDSTLSSMQKTSNYLSQQLARL